MSEQTKLHPAPEIVLPGDLHTVGYTVHTHPAAMRVYEVRAIYGKAPPVTVSVGERNGYGDLFPPRITAGEAQLFERADALNRIDEIRTALIIMDAEEDARRAWAEAEPQ